MILRPLLELAAILAFFAADAAGWIPFSKTPFMVVFIAVMLRWQGATWASIGLTRPAALWRSVGRGALLGLALEAFATLVTTPALTRWLGQAPDLSDLAAIQGNAAMLALFLVLNWGLAAFGEEIVYRGFVTTRVAALAGAGPRAPLVALLVTSVLFAFAHGYQGTTGILQEGLSGLLLGLVAWRAGGNLTEAIVAHGVSNSVAFILIYLRLYPGLG